MQLASFSGNNFFLGHAAMLVNEGLPDYIANELRKRYPLTQMTVAILGMAFKGESDDPRESLSYKLRKRLLLECKSVLCTDPFVTDDRFVPLQTVYECADLAIIGSPHREYREFDLGDRPVIDVWNHCFRGVHIL